MRQWKYEAALGYSMVTRSLTVVLKSKGQQEKTKNPVYFHLADPSVWQPILTAKRIFLFLDLDGTLAEIAVTPGEIALSPEKRRYLAVLATMPSLQVAVVSGRRIEQVQAIVGLQGVFYVGLHGLVILTPQGEEICYPVGHEVVDALQSMRERFDSSFSEIPGLLLEDKGLTLALHFRRAKEEEASKVVREFVHIALTHQERGLPLEILEGKEVIEVKPAGMDKGKAVTYLLGQNGKGALAIYLGDDATDETAFQVLGSRGISILVTDTPRPTAAFFYLHDPAEVEEFLQTLIRRLSALPPGSVQAR